MKIFSQRIKNTLTKNLSLNSLKGISFLTLNLNDLDHQTWTCLNNRDDAIKKNDKYKQVNLTNLMNELSNCYKIIMFLKRLFFCYLFSRVTANEQENIWVGRRGRGRGRENLKKTSCWVWSPTRDLIPRPWDHDLSCSQESDRRLTHWATQVPRKQNSWKQEWCCKEIRTMDRL